MMGCRRGGGLPLLALLGLAAVVLVLAAHGAAGQQLEHAEADSGDIGDDHMCGSPPLCLPPRAQRGHREPARARRRAPLLPLPLTGALPASCTPALRGPAAGSPARCSLRAPRRVPRCCP
jgi:hypothetical protein